jgi:UDP-N-acetylglucosamine 2-epimerase (non-hydrolysing)
MTAFCGALAAFYNKVPVFHIEAGLRSNNLFEPFPEEAMRQFIARIAFLHFAPTNEAKENLLKENIPKKNIFVVGNTGIDALFTLPQKTLQKAKILLKRQNIEIKKDLILVTIHRRENHGRRLDGICSAVKRLAVKYKNCQFVLPVHPNPNVKEKIYSVLNNFSNIILTPPLDYPQLIYLMKHSKLIITDSGGIQEEAPSFNVPVLVTRYETERKEGIRLGFAKLVGTQEEVIVKEAQKILTDFKYKNNLNFKNNPYGDGKANFKIEQAIRKFLFGNKKGTL